VAAGDALVSNVPCQAGSAAGFACRNVDLLAWLPTDVFGLGAGSDIWGWTDPRSGRDYAIMGFVGGVAFIDLSDPRHPVHLGTLATQSFASIWKDIKVYRDHAFIVSEAPRHGMQIFDLSQLASVVDPPVSFSVDSRYVFFSNAHNVALNQETGLLAAVGGNCEGGLHLVDVSRPLEPLFAGCYTGDGYTHDAQCVTYHGPDAEHHGREVCFNSNEDTLTIVDVTNRMDARLLARAGYPDNGYAHQGWLTEDHAYFLLGDEFDELRLGHPTRTYVWDLSDLDAPRLVGSYFGAGNAIDHNQFVVRNHVFQANYRAGLRILRMGDLSRVELAEVAFFDTFPADDEPFFSGAWGVYPFFESGIVIVSDIGRGLFVLRPHLDAVPQCSDGLDNDRDGQIDHPADSTCADANGAAEAPRRDVAIDLEPRDPANRLRLHSGRRVPIAVLGSREFDVGTIDRATLRFGPGAEPPHHGRLRTRDVNADGIPDLVGRYRVRDARLEAGASVACLFWRTRDGTAYEGCDAVRSRRGRHSSRGRTRH
jgi:choice-of-anchor B domain-containing protein